MRSLELFDLTGKTAIVTGGGRGLGFVMAEALAEAGSNVVICSRKQEACESAAKKLNNNGIKALGFECDITNPFQVERLKQYVLSELGQIDILINNSAITWGASFEEYPLDKWERVIEVNVTGTFICCQIIGQAMVDNDCGKIINIGSVYGQIGSPPRSDAGNRLPCKQGSGSNLYQGFGRQMGQTQHTSQHNRPRFHRKRSLPRHYGKGKARNPCSRTHQKIR